MVPTHKGDQKGELLIHLIPRGDDRENVLFSSQNRQQHLPTSAPRAQRVSAMCHPHLQVGSDHKQPTPAPQHIPLGGMANPCVQSLPGAVPAGHRWVFHLPLGWEQPRARLQHDLVSSHEVQPKDTGSFCSFLGVLKETERRGIEGRKVALLGWGLLSWKADPMLEQALEGAGIKKELRVLCPQP